MLAAVVATAIPHVQPLHHRKNFCHQGVLSVDRSGENCLGPAPDCLVGYQEVSISVPDLCPGINVLHEI